MTKYLALKIDVDTHRGTRLGAPALSKMLYHRHIPATWLWSLGPDTTGRAIFRIFRPGFLQKVSRTSVVSLYGVRSLLNGTLLPPPHIGKRNKTLIKSLDIPLFEHGIHCWNHTRWQDRMHTWTPHRTTQELQQAQHMFTTIFNRPAICAGAPGWQVHPQSLQAYDTIGIQYASDTRAINCTSPNAQPFLPRMGGQDFHALQIPSTLPTLDELIGRVHYPLNSLQGQYLKWIGTPQNPTQDTYDVMTIHAEIEGMAYLKWFTHFVDSCLAQDIQFITLGDIYTRIYAQKSPPHRRNITIGAIDGRSGVLGM